MEELKTNISDVMKVYNELQRHDIIAGYQLERTLNMENRKMRKIITDLRTLFENDEVDYYVCANELGYFLSDKLEDAKASLIDREKKAKRMLVDISRAKKAFKRREQQKLEIGE